MRIALAGATPQPAAACVVAAFLPRLVLLDGLELVAGMPLPYFRRLVMSKKALQH